MPATITIIALSAVLWFLVVISKSPALLDLLAFSSAFAHQPYIWTAVTWPFHDGSNPLFMLLALLWAFNVAGSLERSWGTRVFVTFFLVTNALTATTYYFGSLLLHTPIVLSGLWIGLSSLTVAWCLLNRRETVCLGFVLPVPALWIAILELLIVWYELGPPLLGLFALSGCAAAWWYVEKGRSWRLSGYSDRSYLKPPSQRRRTNPEAERGGFNLARYLRARREQRRLEEMFRRSGFDDKDQR
jgi:hypothetical protein